MTHDDRMAQLELEVRQLRTALDDARKALADRITQLEMESTTGRIQKLCSGCNQMVSIAWGRLLPHNLGHVRCANSSAIPNV